MKCIWKRVYTSSIRVHFARYISFSIFLLPHFRAKKNQRKRTFIDIRVRFNISIYSLHLPLKWCVYLYSAWLHLFLSLGSLLVHLLFLFLSALPGQERPTTITIATICTPTNATFLSFNSLFFDVNNIVTFFFFFAAAFELCGHTKETIKSTNAWLFSLSS